MCVVRVMPRRPGDLDTLFADCSLAYKKLGWKADYDTDDACRDAWRWQSNNPMGFEDDSNAEELTKTDLKKDTPLITNITNKNEKNDNVGNDNGSKINSKQENNKMVKVFDYKKIMIRSFVILIIAIAAYALMKAMNVHYLE